MQASKYRWRSPTVQLKMLFPSRTGFLNDYFSTTPESIDRFVMDIRNVNQFAVVWWLLLLPCKQSLIRSNQLDSRYAAFTALTVAQNFIYFLYPDNLIKSLTMDINQTLCIEISPSLQNPSVSTRSLMTQKLNPMYRVAT